MRSESPEALLTDDSRRVLVVDDDDAIRTMVERVLGREGFEVDHARNGLEAIQKIARNDYGAILLDLMMPRLDGVGVLQFVVEKRPDLERSVIVMTADVPRASEISRTASHARVLSKPFDLMELLVEIRLSAAAHAP
jgi:DNA-binding response OmpR family regulator